MRRWPTAHLFSLDEAGRKCVLSQVDRIGLSGQAAGELKGQLMLLVLLVFIKPNFSVSI